ncbi:MAG TPA: serine hydrolase domain-containing protein [Candidatus Binatia bacterium]|nr:serine hydrolase domain-containing protein [Candidatus Binatia bacterium]
MRKPFRPSLALLVALVLCPLVVHAQAARPRAGDEIAGLSRERLARIGPVMLEQVERGIFPGAVTLVARRGTIVHHEAHGYLDAAKTRPMTRDAIFRLASMTKPVVSVAAMMLVERGAVKLNDPITTWLPELKELKVETPAGDVPLDRPITVHDLLRHTAGFVYAGSTKSARIKKMYEEANIEARETDITGDEMLRRLGQIPLAHQPGTFWEYSIATDVLGLLLERVAKKPLDQLLREMLFEPLGMKDTAFWVPPDRAARLADAFDADPLKATLAKAYRILENPAGRSYLKGGAGLVGTGEDYFRFAQMVLNGGEFQGKRYLSRKTVEFMLSDHTVGLGGTTVATTGPGYGFGLGFGVRLHEGVAWVPGSRGDAMWAGIWGTSFWIDPKEQLLGILMAQGPSHRIHTRMLYKNVVYAALVR